MADIERGQRIKARREELGLSQPEVVDEIERLAWLLPTTSRLHPDQPRLKDPSARSKPPVTLRGYQSWEAGGGIDPGKAKLLAEALQTDTRALINGVPREAETPDPFAGNPTANDQVKALTEKLDQLGDRLAVLEAQNALLLENVQAIADAVSLSAVEEAALIVDGIETAWREGKLPPVPAPTSKPTASKRETKRTPAA